jgi:N-acetylmuramoyl-L-alanine amidase
MKPKLYLSASCQEKNIGVDGISEEERMQKLALDIVWYLRPYIDVKLNHPDMTLSEIIKSSNDWRPDFHLALHSNAMPKPGTASGIEALIHDDSLKGVRMANILLPKLSRVMNLQIRRGKEYLAKETTIDTETRIAEVDKTKAPACLVELFFHDNWGDLRSFILHYDEVKKCLVDGILEYFEVTKRSFIDCEL